MSRFLLLTFFFVTACGSRAEAPHPEQQPTLAAPSLPPPLSPRSVSSPTAFDLYASLDHVLFAWSDERSNINFAELGRFGEAGNTLDFGRAEEGRTVTEVLVTADQDGTHIAWIERGGAVHIVKVRSRTAGSQFGPARTLGRFRTSQTSLGRGYLARHFGPAGQAALGYRLDEPTCAGDACGTFRVTPLGTATGQVSAGSEQTENAGVTLNVEEPCTSPFALDAVSTGQRRFSAVCFNRERIPRLSLLSVNNETSYAATFETLVGCQPTGLVSLSIGAIAVGICAGRRTAQLIAQDGSGVGPPVPLNAAVVCRGDVAHLQVSVGRQADLSPLTTPRMDLSSLLGADIAPPYSKVIWTGQSLLVALPLSNQVSLRRFGCRSDYLVRTDLDETQ